MVGTLSNTHRGILLIVVTALAISLQDLVFKLFSGDLTLLQIFALRGVIALPLLVAIGGMQGGWFNILRSAFQLWPLMRGLCLTLTFLAFYAAIPFLNLSTVGAANYLAPIFVALLSAFVIGERVGRLGWVGVVLGFLGVIVLLKPGTDAFSPFAVLPIFGAAFYAMGHIITRTRCQDISASALALALNFVMPLAGLGITLMLLIFPPAKTAAQAYPYLIGAWVPVTAQDWLVLAGLAGFAVLIGMMLAGAYKIAPPATVATFEYSYLVFVAAWDILFFGIALTGTSILGSE